MPTVRQLTTRFTFETDRSGIRKFKEQVGGMKRTVAALALAFGASKIVKSLVDLGSGIGTAVVRARQFTDEVQILRNNTVRLTGDMADSFDEVKRAVPGRVVLSDFLNGFADFKQFLKGGTIQQFNKLFIAAGRIAKITGEDVGSTFKALQEAAKSGDVSGLAKVLSGIDVKDVQMQNFVNQLTAVDPTGVVTIEQRMARFFKILDQNEGALAKFARDITMGTFAGQVRELRTSLRSLGENIGLRLTKPMMRATTAVTAFFDEWDARGPTLDGFLETIKERSVALGIFFELIFRLVGKFGSVTEEMAVAAERIARAIKSVFGKEKQPKPTAKVDPRGPEVHLREVNPLDVNMIPLSRGNVNINVKIAITGASDPERTAVLTGQKLEDAVRRALLGFPAVESTGR